MIGHQRERQLVALPLLLSPLNPPGCGISACLRLPMTSAAAAAVGGSVHTDHRYRANLNASPTYNHNAMSDR